MNKIEKLMTELFPDGVEFRELGKICDFLNGKGHEKNIVENGKYIVVNSKFVSTEGFVKKYSDKQISPIYKDDILMVMSDLPNGKALAKCFIVAEDNKYTLNQRIGALTVKNKQKVNPKFLYYISNRNQQLLRFDNGADQTNLRKDNILKILIPIPPLAIQEEIVKILSTFTALETELETELETRKKQYEYYREELLTFREDIEKKTLGEIAEYRRGSFPQPYGEKKWYDGDGAMPFVQVVDVGEDMRLVEDTKNKISKLAQPKSVFVPADTVIVTLQGSIGRVAITQYDSYVDRTLAIFEKFKMEINKRYFAYQLQKKFGIEKEKARGSTIKTITKEEFTKFKIPIPPFAEQQRIVAILNKFDALVNDISIGLPAELNARRKQYEYYRDKLLTFKPLEKEYAKQ